MADHKDELAASQRKLLNRTAAQQEQYERNEELIEEDRRSEQRDTEAIVDLLTETLAVLARHGNPGAKQHEIPHIRPFSDRPPVPGAISWVSDKLKQERAPGWAADGSDGTYVLLTDGRVYQFDVFHHSRPGHNSMSIWAKRRLSRALGWDDDGRVQSYPVPSTYGSIEPRLNKMKNERARIRQQVSDELAELLLRNGVTI